MKACQRGKELLLSLKRSEFLPPYDEEGVRSVLQEMNSLWQELYATLEGGNREDIPDSIKAGLVFHHHCLLRDKQYAIAYHQYRLARIRELRWQAGSVLPENIRSLLSAHEMQYLRDYDALLVHTMGQMGLDLTSDLEPPKELFIEVRVVHDCGEIMTDQGAVRLDKGTTHYLLRSDVEQLIRQGMLEQVEFSSS